MVPDEVDMEHEVVNCGMCIVKEMNVVKGEKELLRKEVGELRKEIRELKKEVGELRVQSINEDKEAAEVKTQEEDSWAIVAKKMKSHNAFERLETVESDMIVNKSEIRKEVKSPNEGLQTTQPTSGGAVTEVSSYCANCVEPPRPQQWGPDLPFLGHAGHADPLDGWRCCSQKRVMSRPIQVRQL